MKRKTFGRLTAEMNAESNILINLNNILQKFQSSAEQCLIYLHMEQRTRCFLYLGNMFKGARFDVKNSVALETDAEVIKLETEFRHIEEVLSTNLQPKKYRFVFEGLGKFLNRQQTSCDWHFSDNFRNQKRSSIRQSTDGRMSAYD